MSGDLSQTEISPELALRLAWLKELRQHLKLAPLEIGEEAQVVETVSKRDRSVIDFASEQALNSAQLSNVKRHLPGVIDEARAIEGTSDQQESRLSDALEQVRSAVELGRGEDAQQKLRSYEILVAQVSSEIIAQRNQTSIDEAYGAAMKSSLTRTLDTLNKEAQGIGGRTKSEETLLKTHVETAQKFLDDEDYESAQRELNELENSIAAVSAAVIERARRADVVASLQRRYTATRAYAQEITSRDLKMNNPSPQLNKREADIHIIRTDGLKLVEAAEKLADSPDRTAFDKAVAAAVEKIDELKTASAKRDQELCATTGNAKSEELKKQLGDLLKKLSKDSFKKFYAAMRKAFEGYTEWKKKGRHKESLADLATVEDGTRVAQEFIQVKEQVDLSHEKVQQTKATLPQHREQLKNLYASALQEADSLLANQLSAKEAFQPLVQLLEQVGEYNETRIDLESKLTKARENWLPLAGRVDKEQAEVGRAIEDWINAEPPPLEEIKTFAADVNSTLERMRLVDKALRDFDLEAVEWRKLPSECSGALTAYGKQLRVQIEEFVKSAPSMGYEKVAEVFNRSKRERISKGLKQIATALKNGDGKVKSEKNVDVKQFYTEGVKQLIGELDHTAPESFENAAGVAEALVKNIAESGELSKLLGSYKTRIENLQNFPKGCTLLKNTLERATALVTKDPAEGTNILTRELKPLLSAADSLCQARKPLRNRMKVVTNLVRDPQDKMLQRQQKESENLANNATKPENLTEAAEKTRTLLELLTAVEAYAVSRNNAAAAYAAAANLYHPENKQTVLDEDQQSDLAIEQLKASVASATTPPSFTAAAKKLDQLIQPLGERLKTRQAEIQNHLKTKLNKSDELKGVVDKLTSLKGGVATFNSLSRSLGEDELIALVTQVHRAKRVTTPSGDIGDDVANTLGQLSTVIAPEQLKGFINDGCGGASGMATLLEQGFEGSTTQLSELSKAYPDADKLKKLIDEGYGDVETMSKVVRSGKCSAKSLKDLDDQFDHKSFKDLLEVGFGSPEAMGEVFRNGCKGKAEKLKTLSTELSNDELNDLLNDGCGDAKALGSLLGTGFDGDPTKLKTLNTSFSGDLSQLKEIVDGFGGEKCGSNVRDVLSLHYGGDVAKLKTKLYDEIKTGYPASKAKRAKLFKAAPSFKCKTASKNMMDVPIDKDKFTNVRVDHFLDRHSRDYFDFGDIKTEQTFWPPDFPVKDIERALKSTLAATKNLPDFDTLPVGNSDEFEQELPEFGIKVKIGYKKYDDGTKLCVDMFYPDSSTGTAGTYKDVTPEKFVRKEMETLKKAFNR